MLISLTLGQLGRKGQPPSGCRRPSAKLRGALRPLTMATPGTLAIDLGSTTTVVAFQSAEGGAPQLVEIPPYSCADPCVVPSLLWLASATAEQPLIGRQVIEAGLAGSEGPELCRDFKRGIGGCADAGREEGAVGAAAASVLSPEQAGAMLLRQLWRHLPVQLAPTRLVLTAPIDGYRGYREWLHAVSQDLAVEEVALVDEPTAAAIGAGLPPGSRVLVVDLGGGTIDLSLVALEGGEGRAAPVAQLLRFAGRDLRNSSQKLRCARVVGKAGVALGGRDIDRWIAAALWAQVNGQGPPPGTLLEAAESLKCRLSDSAEASVLTMLPGGTSRLLQLSRQELETTLLEQGFLSLLEELLERVLAAARAEGLALADVEAILPVGGSSRIPLVRRWLQERCPGVPLRDERPIEAVALGALALTPGVRIKDVLARGVSLRCWDQRSGSHRWHPLFVEGQNWPTTQPLELLLACSDDGQEQIDLVLGEPRDDERSEVVFRDGLPQLRRRPAGEAEVQPWGQQPAPISLDTPGKRGSDCLRLHFQIDGQGQLVLESEDLSTSRRSPPQPLGPVR